MKVNISVLIVEDEPAIIRGIEISIARFSKAFKIVGTAYNGQEGLEILRKEKPQLVFTDIRMPVMTGLEMIEEAIKLNIDSQFVILSGYSEFDYAKKAMQFGVKEYILKPIIPEEIQAVLEKAEQAYEANLKREMEEYVMRVLAHPKNMNELNNPFTPYDCVIMFSYYGPVANVFATDFNIGKEVVLLIDGEFVAGLEAKYKIQLLKLRGLHYNEILYVAVIPAGEVICMESFTLDLWEAIKSSETYTNLIVSKRIIAGTDIPSVVNECNLFTLFHLPFGKSSVLRCKRFDTSKAPAVSEFVFHKCGKLSKYISQKELKNLVMELTEFWEEKEITQFQLQTDLRYCLNYLLIFEGADKQYSVNVDEIMASCNSFQDLAGSLVFEMEELLQIKENEWHNPASRQIIYQVRAYLEQNYTQPLSSKIFNEKFGYNEKYITSLYKAEFGITPGKYISELRIELAKKIMREDPYILLKDVAVQTGYMDALYFGRVFKGRVGINPSRYLQELRDGEGDSSFPTAGFSEDPPQPF